MFRVVCVLLCMCCYALVFFVKQKTAYEMRISDWSSDVCSSDLDLWQLLQGPTRECRDADHHPRYHRDIRASVLEEAAIGLDADRHIGRIFGQEIDQQQFLLSRREDEFGAEGLIGSQLRACRRGVGAVDEQRRSEGRRVGKECVSSCRFRWRADHKKKK